MYEKLKSEELKIVFELNDAIPKITLPTLEEYIIDARSRLKPNLKRT
jgi:hypothetical protein